MISGKHMPRFPLFLVVAAMVLLLACAPKATPAPVASPAPAAAPAPAVSPEWQKVVETARKEGRVTLYQSTGPAAYPIITEQFPKQTGIRAELLSVRPAETKERLRIERQSGAYNADVVVSAITTVDDVSDFGQPVSVELPVEKEKGALRVQPWQYDSERRIVMVWAQQVNPGILVNTKMVKEAEVQSWYDLLDPKWKGKMVMTDPRHPVAGAGAMAYAASELGIDFWKKIAAQGIRYEREGNMVIQAVALGEKAIAIFPKVSEGDAAILAGVPAKFVHLKEGSMLILYGALVVKSAPHPNAAMVYLNWVVSKSGHEPVMSALKWAGIRKDIDPRWLEIPEHRPDAPKRVFSKVATKAQDSQGIVAFMVEALGKL